MYLNLHEASSTVTEPFKPFVVQTSGLFHKFDTVKSDGPLTYILRGHRLYFPKILRFFF